MLRDHREGRHPTTPTPLLRPERRCGVPKNIGGIFWFSLLEVVVSDFVERRCRGLALEFERVAGGLSPDVVGVVGAYVSALRSECASARVEVRELSALLSGVTGG